MLVLAHLEGSAALYTGSGMPVEGAFALLRYNLLALREWTPQQVDEALRESMKP